MARSRLPALLGLALALLTVLAYGRVCGNGFINLDDGNFVTDNRQVQAGLSPRTFAWAWTTLDGKQLKIFDAKPLPAKDPKGIGGKLGEIVAVEADGFTVVCADGRFKISRVQPADGKKIEAGDWAKSAGITAGAIFDKP